MCSFIAYPLVDDHTYDYMCRLTGMGVRVNDAFRVVRAANGLNRDVSFRRDPGRWPVPNRDVLIATRARKLRRWNDYGATPAGLSRAGENTLPLGLKRTVEVHMQLFAGSRYRLAADRELPLEQVREALEAALAMTAGRTGAQADAASTLAAVARENSATDRPGHKDSGRRTTRLARGTSMDRTHGTDALRARLIELETALPGLHSL